MAMRRTAAWIATVFDTENFRLDQLQRYGNGLKYGKAGKETCPTTNRQRLQCYFLYNSRIRCSNIIQCLLHGSHVEPARDKFSKFRFQSFIIN